MRDLGVPSYNALKSLVYAISIDFKKNRSRYPKSKSDLLEWAARSRRVAIDYSNPYESSEWAIGIPAYGQGRKRYVLEDAVVADGGTQMVSLIRKYEPKQLRYSKVYVLTPRMNREFLVTLPPLHVVSEFVEKAGKQIKNTELQMGELELIPEVSRHKQLLQTILKLEKERELAKNNLPILESIFGGKDKKM